MMIENAGEYIWKIANRRNQIGLQHFRSPPNIIRGMGNDELMAVSHPSSNRPRFFVISLGFFFDLKSFFHPFSFLEIKKKSIYYYYQQRVLPCGLLNKYTQ
jgi:hypothetical protein